MALLVAGGVARTARAVLQRRAGYWRDAGWFQACRGFQRLPRFKQTRRQTFNEAGKCMEDDEHTKQQPDDGKKTAERAVLYQATCAATKQLARTSGKI